MSNKLLLFLSILVSIFIGFCMAVIFSIKNPTFNTFLSKVSDIKVEELKPSSSVAPESSVVETMSIPTIEAIKKLSSDVVEYTSHEGRVSIEYPTISGMDDDDLQYQINKKIFDNAKSIVALYPISTSMQTLEITCEVEELNKNRLTIIYTGRVFGKTVVADNSTPAPTPTRPAVILPTPTLPQPTQPGLNLQGINGHYSPTNGGQSMMPFFANQGQSGLPSGGPTFGVIGFSKTIALDQKIFYTNCIDMKTGRDISLRDYVQPETLAKVARSSKAEYVNVSFADYDTVRAYVLKSSVASLTEVFRKADFRNENLKAWPKSFSYVKDNYIYFTVKLSSKLGNYVIIKYKYQED